MKEWKIRLLKAGVSQKEFCKYAGLNYTLFSNYVNGKVTLISIERIKYIDEKLKELENENE